MDGAPTIKTAETRERFTSGDWSLEVIPEGHQITAGPHVYVGLVQLASDDDARLMASARALFEALAAAITAWERLYPLLPVSKTFEDAEFNEFLKARAALARARGEPTPSPNDRSGA